MCSTSLYLALLRGISEVLGIIRALLSDTSLVELHENAGIININDNKKIIFFIRLYLLFKD